MSRLVVPLFFLACALWLGGFIAHLVYRDRLGELIGFDQANVRAILMIAVFALMAFAYRSRAMIAFLHKQEAERDEMLSRLAAEDELIAKRRQEESE